MAKSINYLINAAAWGINPCSAMVLITDSRYFLFLILPGFFNYMLKMGLIQPSYLK
jgi:hypothetical protein